MDMERGCKYIACLAEKISDSKIKIKKSNHKNILGIRQMIINKKNKNVEAMKKKV